MTDLPRQAIAALGRAIDAQVEVDPNPSPDGRVQYVLTVKGLFDSFEALTTALVLAEGPVAPTVTSPRRQRAPKVEPSTVLEAAIAEADKPDATPQSILTAAMAAEQPTAGYPDEPAQFGDNAPLEVAEPLTEHEQSILDRYEGEIEEGYEFAATGVAEAWTSPEPTIAAVDVDAAICGAGPDPFGDNTFCELAAGHRGYHRAATTTWETPS